MPKVKKNSAPASATSANVGYEAQLWQMADALRGSMDAAEYKHVCLGLLFLKYISDAFEEKHATLLAEKAQGADPEDPDEYRAQSIFWVPPEARWPHLKAQARVIDFDDPSRNDWLAVNQFSVVEHKHSRRPDVVLFVNGLPLALLELKNAAAESATIWSAFQQLQTYQAEVPTLFAPNALIAVSDGVEARVGTLGAGREWFKPWRTVAGDTLAGAHMPELQVVIEGLCAPRLFLDLLRDFIVFEDDGGRIVKKMVGYHQFHAVLVAVGETLRASLPTIPAACKSLAHPLRRNRFVHALPFPTRVKAMWLIKSGDSSGKSKTTRIPGLGIHGQSDELGEQADRANDEKRDHVGLVIERSRRAPRHGSSLALGLYLFTKL